MNSGELEKMCEKMTKGELVKELLACNEKMEKLKEDLESAGSYLGMHAKDRIKAQDFISSISAELFPERVYRVYLKGPSKPGSQRVEDVKSLRVLGVSLKVAIDATARENEKYPLCLGVFKGSDILYWINNSERDMDIEIKPV